MVFRSWITGMMKAICKAYKDTQEKMRLETGSLRLKESMQSSELAIWKENATHVQEAYEARVQKSIQKFMGDPINSIGLQPTNQDEVQPMRENEE